MKRRSFVALLGGVFAVPAVKAEPHAEISEVKTPMDFSSVGNYGQIIIGADYQPGDLIAEGDRFTIEGNPRTYEVVA